jgi:DNA-binding NarL/FixJ family response regulator
MARQVSATGVDVAACVVVLAHSELSGRRVEDALTLEGFELVAPPAAEVPSNSEPDAVVVVDDSNDATQMLEACRRLDGIPVVVVCNATRRLVQQALEAGARGLVPTDDVEARLGPTVRAVAAGQSVIPAESRETTTPLLSAREKQVLSMVVLGFTNVDIANQLFLAESTVKSHLNSAYRKLGVRSRQQATARILGASDGLGLGILSLTEAPAVR